MLSRICIKNLIYYERAHYVQTTCFYSQKKGFLQDFINKLKDEYNRDQKLKDSINKFREETEKLEKSEDIQKMRDYYKKIEREIGVSSSEKVKEAWSIAKNSFNTHLDEISKQELVKKSFQQVNRASESVSRAAQQLSESNLMQMAKEGIKTVDKEFQSDRAMMYASPKVLQTRSELAGKSKERVFEADDKTLGMVMHKDSKWFAAWQNFKDTNSYVQKFFDLKMQYDESDNPLIRSSRFVTDKVREVFGSFSGGSELQDTLTEIAKIDPSFTVEEFLKYVRFEVIPNVLEAIMKGDLKILHDWCHEAPYNVISQPFVQAQKLGLRHDCKVLDVQNIDLTTGKMMEQGPVLVVTFTAQQLQSVRDMKTNKVVEGNPDKIMRVTYVWALCRDQSELNPYASWRLLDIAMLPSEQWI